jgi:hypothetical protein
MAGNSDPIYSKIGHIDGVFFTNTTTAKATSDGVGTIGTDLLLAFTADATNGSYVRNIRIQAVGSTAATASTATTVRVYICELASGATNASFTAPNTFCIAEIAVASQSTDQTTVATYAIDYPLNVALPAGFTLLLSSHVQQASAAVKLCCTVFGGDY